MAKNFLHIFTIIKKKNQQRNLLHNALTKQSAMLKTIKGYFQTSSKFIATKAVSYFHNVSWKR